MSATEQAVAKAFGLTDEVWQRHANPWSVYTRIPIPALLALAVWSRTWIGRWSLLPIGVVGLLGGYCYTAGPYPLKYHALGEVAIIPRMGPLMSQGAWSPVMCEPIVAPQ